MFDPALAHVNTSSSYQNHVSNSHISSQQHNGVNPISNNYPQSSPRYMNATASSLNISNNNSGFHNRYNNTNNMPGLLDVSVANSGTGLLNGGSAMYNGLINYTTPLPPPDERLCGFGSVLSRAPADVQDESNRQGLEHYLQAQGIFENDADLFRRIEALTCLERVCKTWITSVYARLNAYTGEQIEEVAGALFTFGSYRLGVHFRGGDIDTLLLAPRRVEREQFFSEMPQLLSEQPECESVTAVPDAYTPIITMVLGGVEIDLLFCQCMLENVPKQLNVLQIKVQNFTPTLKDLRSLNGCRVNEYILSCVPNQDTFRNALRAIKYWAKRRCIYSNKLGYFGGVSWALLVAFTCQHYPYANAAMIVKKMFLVFSEWEWPQPVFVRDPRDMDGESSSENNLGMPVWDARINMSDRAHMMPIITPVFPQQNTTYNVQKSQYVILVSEMNRGKETCEKIWRNEIKWDKLFEPLPFFHVYKFYLVVITESDSEELFKSYCGFVESRLRKLVELVGLKQEVVRLCHAHPRQFVLARATKSTALWLFGLDLIKKDEKLPAGSFVDVGQNFVADLNSPRAWGDMFRTQVRTANKRELLTLLPEDTIAEDDHLKRFADAVKKQQQNQQKLRSEKAARARAAVAAASASPATASTLTTTTSSPALTAASRLSNSVLNDSELSFNSTSGNEKPASPTSAHVKHSLSYADMHEEGGPARKRLKSVLHDADLSFNSTIGNETPTSPTSTTHVKHSSSYGDMPSVMAPRKRMRDDDSSTEKRLKSSSSSSSISAVKTHSPSPSSPPTATTTTTPTRSPLKVETDLKIMEESNMDRRHMADTAASEQPPAQKTADVDGILPTSNVKSEFDADLLSKPSIVITPSSQLLDTKLPPEFLLKLLPTMQQDEPPTTATPAHPTSATPDLSFTEDDSANNANNTTSSSSSGDDGNISGYGDNVRDFLQLRSTATTTKPIT